jgi:hypothetical protein
MDLVRDRESDLDFLRGLHMARLINDRSWGSVLEESFLIGLLVLEDFCGGFLRRAR